MKRDTEKEKTEETQGLKLCELMGFEAKIVHRLNTDKDPDSPTVDYKQ